ncbi:MAG: PaeR7I family type II restriction endonuclease, partial [Myxococcales bacterium]|nr:PaeR7I family type II restriction endonuclease [Polyangiaceae bacterium]MDW8252028.1 PaeR7I family type II restriction endonuclease [Myxococcales bacterium]
MPLVPEDYKNRTQEAINHYWNTLWSQSTRQQNRDADRGNRTAVTGGKQMDGFCKLIRWVVAENGMPDASIYTQIGVTHPPRNVEEYRAVTLRWPHPRTR